MNGFTFKDALQACGGKYCGEPRLLDEEISDVVIDNRNAGTNSLFVPIKGQRFDGHDFIPQAFSAGALMCVSQREIPGRPHILAESSSDALLAIAGSYRRLFDIPVYGITGSCGKTTTKELISIVLQSKHNVHKTQGNFNNQTGVPLTLFKLNRAHGTAVVEMGTNHFGEIRALAKAARPTHCFITNIGDAHIENFKDRRGTLRAKCEMLEHRDSCGHVYVNGDDPLLAGLRDASKNIYAYGLSEWCDIRGTEIYEHGLDGTDVTVTTPSGTFKMHVPAPGLHMVSNALAAVCAGLTQQVPFADIAAAIANYTPAGSRMKISHTGKYTVLSDAYNANPASVKAALNVLKNAAGRKVAIIGDMAELGDTAQKSHKEIGEYAAQCGADLAVCVGELSKYTYEGAAGAGLNAVWFGDKSELKAGLYNLLKAGDVILVKASHSAGLEEIADLIAYGERV